MQPVNQKQNDNKFYTDKCGKANNYVLAVYLSLPPLSLSIAVKSKFTLSFYHNLSVSFGSPPPPPPPYTNKSHAAYFLRVF